MLNIVEAELPRDLRRQLDEIDDTLQKDEVLKLLQEMMEEVRSCNLARRFSGKIGPEVYHLHAFDENGKRPETQADLKRIELTAEGRSLISEFIRLYVQIKEWRTHISASQAEG